MKDIDTIFQKAHQASENQSFSSFEKVWDKIEDRLDAEPAKKTVPMWKIMGMAASVALLVGMGWFLVQPKTTVAQNSTTEKSIPKAAEVATTENPQQDNTQNATIAQKDDADIPPVPEKPVMVAIHKIPTPFHDPYMGLEVDPPIMDDPNPIMYAQESSRDEIMDDSSIYKEKASNENRKGFGTADYAPPIAEVKDAKKKETIVIGYEKAKKTQPVAAVTSIKTEELLQGKVAGVEIAKTEAKGFDEDNSSRYFKSESKEIASNIRIRGAISLSDNEKPLYVVDGKQMDDISAIKTEDITMVEVLKDSTSTAIYGTRGANGVIIVTTKASLKNKETKKEKKAAKTAKKDSINIKK